MKRPRLWFAGTPEFAAHSLQALIDDGRYAVEAVLTQPDRPAGRGRKLSASPVKTVALAHGIPVEQPEKLLRDAPPFAHLPPPDLIIVAAYGLLLPPWFLDLPRLGCINIHASLLPRWRGAAPIQRAIEAGDTQTGIAIMQMEAGLDTGPVWHSATLLIDDAITGGELHDQLMPLGARTLLQALPAILAADGAPVPQDDALATYAHKLHKDEAAIDWHADPALIARRIRAFSPFPVAHAQLEGDTLRIHRAALIARDSGLPPGSVIAHDENGLDVAVNGATLRITRLQWPGKPVADAAALRHGRPLNGKRFS
ncbi:MAG: methionyl-tRNA formyltransferase [Cardiobacteriaceae bacterium]|nr:methionyl-tRNA formyltransferase [Cardiobacteriaceae bacterium]